MTVRWLVKLGPIKLDLPSIHRWPNGHAKTSACLGRSDPVTKTNLPCGHWQRKEIEENIYGDPEKINCDALKAINHGLVDHFGFVNREGVEEEKKRPGLLLDRALTQMQRARATIDMEKKRRSGEADCRDSKATAPM
ncbi:MAG: hypothetical protein WCF84_27305 [Anaerolineae bacterium]